MNTEFVMYKAKFLNEISHEYVNNSQISLFYDFFTEEFFSLFKISQNEHNKFFWMLNNIKKDFEHYKTEANAWSIPVFSFENKDKAFNRIIKGLGFIWLKGTNKQTKDMLDIVFGKGMWRFNLYSDQLRISLDIIEFSETKAKNALEYLEYAIPPYILIEFVKYPFPDFYKRYSYDDIVFRGGSPFLLKYLNQFVSSTLVLPFEALTIDKSKLNEDLIKRIDETGEDVKTIILFKQIFLSLNNLVFYIFSACYFLDFYKTI